MTYSELRTKLNQYLNRSDTDVTNQTGDWLNLAMRRVERKYNFHHMQIKIVQTMAAADYLLSIPAPRYKELNSVFVYSSDGIRYPLTKHHYRHVMAVYPDLAGDIGQPELIAYVPATETSTSPDVNPTMKFIIRPTADRAYTLETVLYQFSPDLDGSTYTTNWWTDNAWEVLFYGALMEAQPFLVDNQTAIYQQLYQDALLDVINYQRSEEYSGNFAQVTPGVLEVV